MGNTSHSTMQFDADASRAVSALSSLAAQQRAIKKEMTETASTAASGSDIHQRKLDELSKTYIANDNTVKRWKASLNDARLGAAMADVSMEDLRQTIQQLNVAVDDGSVKLTRIRHGADQAAAGMGVMAASTGRANFMIGNAAFAVDDFLTVLQMPGMGMVQALRASANNFSVLLMSIHPLLAILPSLGTAALTVGMNFFKSSENVEKAATVNEKYLDTIRDLIRETKELNGQKAELEFEDEQKELEEMRAPLMQERKRLQDEYQKNIDTWFIPGGARQTRLEEERNQILEQIDTVDFKMREVRTLQQARIDAKRAKEEREKQAERDKEEREKAQEDTQQRIAPLRGPLMQVAAQSLALGASEAEIKAKLGGLVAGKGFGDPEALNQEIANIVSGARASAVSDLMKPGLTPEQRRLQEIRDTLQSRDVELQTQMVGARPSAQKRMQRDFDRKFGAENEALAAEQSRLQLKIAREANAGVEDKQQETNELLSRIAILLETNSPAATPSAPAPSSGRKVARNP